MIFVASFFVGVLLAVPLMPRQYRKGVEAARRKTERDRRVLTGSGVQSARPGTPGEGPA